MVRFNLLFCFALLIACKKEKPSLIQYEQGEQLLTVNGVSNDGKIIDLPIIKKIAPDSVALGQELLVKIVLEDSRFHIANAFVGCAEDAITKVDTATLKIAGCAQQLVVESDTIFIGFSPSKIGVQGFPKLVILVKDNEKVFRVYPYKFQYKVFAE